MHNYVDQLQERLEAAYAHARRELQKSAQANKRKYNVRVRPTEFKSGDKVYLFKKDVIVGSKKNGLESTRDHTK